MDKHFAAEFYQENKWRIPDILMHMFEDYFIRKWKGNIVANSIEYHDGKYVLPFQQRQWKITFKDGLTLEKLALTREVFLSFRRQYGQETGYVIIRRRKH